MKTRPFTLCIVFAVLLSGCGSPPPDKEVTSAIEKYLVEKRIGRFATGNYVQMPNKVQKLEIVNRYDRKKEGEHWYVYDTHADVKAIDATYEVNVKMGFVKRGNEWYSKELDE